MATGPKADPLDTTFDDHPPTLRKGLDPLRLLTGDEPFAGIGVAVASPSRHREQIVEQLAQCR